MTSDVGQHSRANNKAQAAKTTSSPSSDIESLPRLPDATGRWRRVWRRYRFAVITVINLAVFFLIWEILGRHNTIGPSVRFPIVR